MMGWGEDGNGMGIHGDGLGTAGDGVRMRWEWDAELRLPPAR